MRPFLPQNPYLRSLKVDCDKLDDSAIELILQPSLQELCLHNCADFTGKLLSEIGRQCKYLRSLYLGSVAKKRGLSIHISDLEELLNGCTQLEGLFSLTRLDLRDAPLNNSDLTNSDLQQINHHGKLKHLWLIWSQEFLITYFRRVNDLGILLMADKCANMESICLGGFCCFTDTGFKTIFHSCSNLYNLRVSHGPQLTDLVFHVISATSLSLTHVCLRWCNLLTNNAIKSLISNSSLKVLDLRDCKNLGDEALRAISFLPQLKILLFDGSDISDAGVSYLRHGIISSLVSLSLRGCKRLTDKCISVLFDGCSKLQLQELDLSNLPYLSDTGILTLAKSHVPISELLVRQCPLIGDTSVIALASMQDDEDRWYGSSIKLLDLYNCDGITPLACRWLKKPYFPTLMG